MSRLQEFRSFHVELPVEVATQQLIACLSSCKHGRIERVGAGYVEGRLGSQVALRLKGGWFSTIEDFPVVVAAAVHPSPVGSDVRMTVADDLGFGLKFGVKSKYQRALVQTADYLEAALRSANPGPNYSLASGGRHEPLELHPDFSDRPDRKTT